MDTWRQAVIIEAETWLRTPWHHRARSKGAGVDCAQYLIGVYSGAGLVEAFDTGEYPSDWMLHTESELFLPWIDKYMVQVESPEMGDTILWKFGRGFSHAAIVYDYPHIIHAYRKEQAVVFGDASVKELSRRTKRYYTLKRGAV